METDANFDIDKANEILIKLNEQLDLTKSRPTEKAKKKKRALITRGDYKKKLVRQISLLTNKLPKNKPVSVNKKANPTTSTSQGTRQDSGSNTQKSTSSSNKTSESVAADSVNYEELLSDIFNAVKVKIGDEDELYPEICQAIKVVFEERGLFYAEQ